MCGIAGFYSFKKSLPESVLHKMTDTLAHRGPNAKGYFNSVDGKCRMGHRRLSIIDLSDAANQPMPSSCGRYVLVFNGEIYNYKEIKEEILKYKKIEFKTHSDTEVLVEAFALWGKPFIYKLNGMFSIAIYDNQDEVLWLFRDRLGIKPLFYYKSDDLFAFASELKALATLVDEVGKFTINQKAISHYLRLGYIPEPYTIYNEVNKFKSAHLAAVNKNGFSKDSYWNIEKKITKESYADENKVQHKLHEIIESSVEYRMVSDVPFGTFLSGGIDSSLVTAVAQSKSAQSINTFSIGFKESKFNESSYAEEVAKTLNTNHHPFTLSYQDALHKIDKISDAYDEPFADTSSIPTMLVSEMAKKHVTMTLSGDGGDEQFLGYGFYQWAKRLDNSFLKTFKKSIAYGMSKWNNPRMRRKANMFRFNESTYLPSHIFSVENYFFIEEELNDILASNDVEMTFSPQFSLLRKLSKAENQALFDLNYYLKDDLLVKVDRASMQYSLETRVPLLDHRIVEFSLNINESLKWNKHQTKLALKNVLYTYLPASIFDRPKWGFGIPLEDWLKKDLHYLIEKYINQNTIERWNVLNWNSVKTIKEKYLSGETYCYSKLWLIIVLHQWFEKHETIFN